MRPADAEKMTAREPGGPWSKAAVILLLPLVLVLAIIADCLGIGWAEG